MADTPDGFLFEHRVLDVWAIHAAIPAAVGEHYLGILKQRCESDPGAWRLVPFARLDASAEPWGYALAHPGVGCVRATLILRAPRSREELRPFTGEGP